MTPNNNIFTVSRLNKEVRMLLESEMGVIWLMGEISNFSAPTSGHWYFTLKDNNAQVKCAMFRFKNQHVRFRPANGNQVLVRASISLYEPRGDYQIIIESMQPEGDGLLKQQFEELKARLAAEGLFSSDLKQPLPLHPKKIGIITSKTGAALHDILHVLKRRDPSLHVIIYPTQVQGKEATMQIANCIALANKRRECDVLIIGRGGGSLEDLWCFNEEILARSIAASRIPTISAVGHEVDITICDYVADRRAPTPSAAAELVSRDTSYKTQQLATKYTALHRAIEKIISEQDTKLTALQHKLKLSHPQNKLQQQSQRFDHLERRLNQAILQIMQSKKTELERKFTKLEQHSPTKQIANYQTALQLQYQKLCELINNSLQRNKHALNLKMETLNAVSPLATLNRGYSISQNEKGELLRSIEHIQSKQKLVTVVKDGKIYSTVDKVESN